MRWRQINNSKPENVLGDSLIHMNMGNLSMLGYYNEMACAIHIYTVKAEVDPLTNHDWIIFSVLLDILCC